MLVGIGCLFFVPAALGWPLPAVVPRGGSATGSLDRFRSDWAAWVSADVIWRYGWSTWVWAAIGTFILTAAFVFSPQGRSLITSSRMGERARVGVTLLVLASGPLLIGLVGPLLVVSLGWPSSNYGQDATAAELRTACLTVGALVIATVGVVVLRDAVVRVVDGDQEPVRKAQGGR
ncbi:hypothetical protein [Frigoribacterium sp. CFBP 13707]|uniref:hypothetical protein n=1 Tax=Frigoribacterium sp. CFBP 13707 TaxID=2775313 RepID=UPI00177E03C9|nr:hypothetical protein [Frigoribacterium sp. CFBP 13707]MBD8729478.1 hypothetical protein [Frigoribacterium sp. CFBP 13707]